MMTINSVLMVILGSLQSMVHSVKTCGLKDVVIFLTGIKYQNVGKIPQKQREKS
jgi:hypothetical protein